MGKVIWFISHHAMPPQMAVRRRTNDFAKLLVERGHAVEIFSASTIHNTDVNLIRDRAQLYAEYEYDGVIYNHVRTSSYSGNGLKRAINLLQFPIRLLKVYKLKNRKPDVIICNPQSIFGVLPYFISRRVGAGFIAEVRDLWPESIVVYKGISRKNPIIQLMYFFEKWVYRKADKIIFTMEGGKDYIIDKGWGDVVDESKIYHINNGVDLEAFRYNATKWITNDIDLLDDRVFRVMYTGSIRPANGLAKIIDVAKNVQKKGYDDIKFLIYGDGPDREYLEQYCLKNGIYNIKFKGSVEKKYIPSILMRGDLNLLHFKQSSLKKYGSSMNKMFEYFASGRPTLSDCEFGHDLITKYGCGLVIDDATPAQMAEAIIEFYRMDKKEYERYCNNALKAAKDYEVRRLVGQLQSIL